VKGPLTLGVRAPKQPPFTPFIKLAQEGEYWVVRFDPAQLDNPPIVKGAPSPTPPSNPFAQDTTLCRVHQETASGLIFLHSPLEKGRASLCVLAVPTALPEDTAVRSGVSNQPLTMASIEWHVAAEATELEITSETEPSIRLTSASSTTLMNWTRTGRNFDVWLAGDGTAFSSQALSSVVALRGASSCTFEADETGKALCFVPERSRYPNPLYVQRHLAVIATRDAPGIGRPVEVFHSVFRLLGRDMPQLKDAKAVRLVEFEAPARPLVFLRSLESFNVAHFDLFSILGNSTDLPSGFSIHMRLLGGDALNLNLPQLSVRLRLIMKDTAHKLSGRITVGNKHSTLIWCGLSLAVVTTQQIAITGKGIYEGGTTDDLDITWVADATSTLIGADLGDVLAVDIEADTIKVPPGTSEYWTDASLLTLPQRDSVDFTFDWFFTGNDPSSPSEAVSAVGLRDMVEAQARIIAVSPPIRVQDR
jgi:hypothetical protein